MSQPTLISHLLHRAGKKIFGKEISRARITMPRLLEAWTDLIAPDDATQILPSRIVWKKNPDGTSSGTLHILAPSALAAKLMYRERIIIERVNRAFGLPPNSCLSRMAVTHSSQSARKFTPPPKPVNISADTAEHLAKIEDPVLREKLESLARSMASKNLP